MRAIAATLILSAVMCLFIFAWVIPVYQIKDYPYDIETVSP